jgi:hypothetical protein
VGTDALAIEKAKRSQPAILLAPDPVEKLATPQPEPERASRTLPVNTAHTSTDWKGSQASFDTEKTSPVARARIVGMKMIGERSADALACLIVRVRNEPQNLVVIGGKASCSEHFPAPEIQFGVCQFCGRHVRSFRRMTFFKRLPAFSR